MKLVEAKILEKHVQRRIKVGLDLGDTIVQATQFTIGRILCRIVETEITDFAFQAIDEMIDLPVVADGQAADESRWIVVEVGPTDDVVVIIMHINVASSAPGECANIKADKLKIGAVSAMAAVDSVAANSPIAQHFIL